MSLFHTELPKDTAICPYCKIEYDVHGFHACGATGEIIAARDKEWVSKIESFLVSDNTGFGNPSRYILPRRKWQQLKKDMRVKE